MRKIGYSRIKWGATTNWEFCGSKENLLEVCRRASEHRGARIPIEEFGYSKPNPVHAYKTGDVVSCTVNGHQTLSVVEIPAATDEWFYVRLPNGHWLRFSPIEIASKVSIADVPEELVMLARAEAGMPIDPSKCPLKEVCARMKGSEA